MYSPNPIWERYKITRKFVRYLRQYTDTLVFRVSAPGSSIFWILSSIFDDVFRSTHDIIITEVTITSQGVLALLALSVLIGPAVYFAIRHRPFHVTVEWDPLQGRDMDIRAKRRGRVVLRDDEALIRLKVFFDESVNEYALKFDSDDPLTAKPTDEPTNADYDDGILRAQNIDNPKFYFGVRIRSDDDLQQYDPEVRIRDNKDGDKLLLRIGVT